MASKLRIPSPLRRFTDGEASIDVNGDKAIDLAKRYKHEDVVEYLECNFV